MILDEMKKHVAALMSRGDPALMPLLAALVPLLKEDNLREEASELLGDVTLSGPAIGALVQLAADAAAESEVRGAALRLLDNVESTQLAPHVAAVVRPLAELAADDNADEHARLAAIHVLGAASSIDLDVHAAALVPLLKEYELRVEAFELFERVTLDGPAIQALLDAVAGGEDEFGYADFDARRAAITVLRDALEHGKAKSALEEHLIPIDEGLYYTLAYVNYRESDGVCTGLEFFEEVSALLEEAGALSGYLVQLVADTDQDPRARMAALESLSIGEDDEVPIIGEDLIGTIVGMLDDDFMGDAAKEKLESFLTSSVRVATMNALIAFAVGGTSAPSRMSAMELLSKVNTSDLGDLDLSDDLIKAAARILAENLHLSDDGDDEPDEEVIAQARLRLCELLSAIKHDDVDRLLPHVSTIASLHSGPAKDGTRQLFCKLACPDQPSRIVSLLGNNESRVRLLCLIALQSYSALPLPEAIWSAVAALQTDSSDEVKTIASLMVQNQFQPGGVMYQETESSFANRAAAQASEPGPPPLKRAKTAP